MLLQFYCDLCVYVDGFFFFWGGEGLYTECYGILRFVIHSAEKKKIA